MAPAAKAAPKQPASKGGKGSDKDAAANEFTLENVLSVIPEGLRKADNRQALIRMGAALGAFAVSVALLASDIFPWYFLPLLWLFGGLAMTGLFAVAHDCGHYSFFKQRWLNTLVGGAFFLPLLYPLEGWRLHHGEHHNSRSADRGLKPQKSKSLIRLVNPLFWPYDIVTLVLVYFDLSRFDEQEQRDSRLGVLAAYGFGALFFPLVIYYAGVWALVKIWLAPWFVFHFWKNALRRALPAVTFSYPDAAKSRKYLVESKDGLQSWLTELTHYSFPRWFELMAHDVNYQIPHYLDAEIPSYHLRAAHYAILQSRFGDRVNQYSFGWGLLTAARKAQEAATEVAESAQREVSKLTMTDVVSFLKTLNWFHVPMFIMTHALALYGFLTVDYVHKTTVWAIVYYFYTGFGITGGYHRFWAHRAFDAVLPVRIAMMLAGTGAMEGSIKWWCRDHRVHHRYTDTDKDPYNARRGFFYSHMGWMLIKEDHNRLGKVNIDDLLADPMVQWQHRNFIPLALFMGFGFPTLVAGLGWGDWYGGFFLAGVLRLCMVHHATFCVNSLAHYVGDQTFADRHTPRDSFITAVMTLGEGYHNFHHEFPKDYRNAIQFWQYDPTKWIVRTLAFFGLAYNLHTFPENEIQKGRVQMMVKKVKTAREQLDWGEEIKDLPVMTMEDVAAHKEDGWMVIGGVVHDCKDWTKDHPGGAKLLVGFYGKDATDAFNGGVYNHSNAGRNLASQLRIGRIKGATLIDAQLEAAGHHHNELPEDQYVVLFPKKEGKED
jgi:stearoyl-CoA desaturase (Delta-9 desaturase)